MRALLFAAFFVATCAQDIFLHRPAASLHAHLSRDRGGDIPFDGADVVAYWSLPAGAPRVLGRPEFNATYVARDRANETNSWTYTLHFSNAANRDMFVAEPAKYLPQWGGFCAWGISQEMSPDWPWARDYLGPPGNSSTWYIYDGRLYFTFMPGLINHWMEHAKENVAVGDGRWGDWFGSLDRGPLNVDCTADAWWGDTCCYTPQVNDGIAPRKLIEDSCLAAMHVYCSDVEEGKTGGPGLCSLCLKKHTSDILSTLGNKCPVDPTDASAIGQLAEKVYCF